MNSVGDVTNVTIGVLSLHGSVEEHRAHLKKAATAMGLAEHVVSIEVRTPSDLSKCDGLILPGGESTVFHSLSTRSGLWESLKTFVHSDRKPVLGTCAGLILLSNEIEGASVGQSTIGGLHIKTKRNAYGRQDGSFVGSIQCGVDGEGNITNDGKSDASNGNTNESVGVFIRAPGIVSVGDAAEGSSTVSVLGSLKKDNSIVAVSEGNILALAFHPELTEDTRWHAAFIRKCRDIQTVRSKLGGTDKNS